MKIGASAVATEAVTGGPGEVLAVDKENGVLVACGSGNIWLKLVQPEGKKMMSAQDFIRGYGMKPGDVLETEKN